MSEILAGVGITLGALASLPQIVKSIRARDTSSLDARSMLLRILAALTWASWALLRNDRDILLSALANILVETILVVVKYRYGVLSAPQTYYDDQPAAPRLRSPRTASDLDSDAPSTASLRPPTV